MTTFPALLALSCSLLAGCALATDETEDETTDQAELGQAGALPNGVDCVVECPDHGEDIPSGGTYQVCLPPSECMEGTTFMTVTAYEPCFVGANPYGGMPLQCVIDLRIHNQTLRVLQGE